MNYTPNPSSEDFSYDNYDNCDNLTDESSSKVSAIDLYSEDIYDLIVKAKELYDIIIFYAEHNDIYLLDHPNSYQDFLELYISYCI